MENQEYLNQIAGQNRPLEKPRNGILSSKFFIVSVIGIVLFFLIMIIGGIVGGNKDGLKSKNYALSLHLENTSAVIKNYQSSIKSSVLRSNTASLYSAFSDINKKLNDYMSEKYSLKAKDMDKKIADEATVNKDGLEVELFEAKINGILDRTFAYKMAYEISMVMTEESQIYNSAKDDTLKEILSESYTSLEKLYDKFNDFSETK
ncbi:hypothetical protein IKG33_02445 [Candidatus Saccharibacteria bacterium]|nr:hypothetical protein [Candidatus Saccharibacteria bacterium]